MSLSQCSGCACSQSDAGKHWSICSRFYIISVASEGLGNWDQDAKKRVTLRTASGSEPKWAVGSGESGESTGSDRRFWGGPGRDSRWKNPATATNAWLLFAAHGQRHSGYATKQKVHSWENVSWNTPMTLPETDTQGMEGKGDRPARQWNCPLLRVWIFLY